MFNEKNLTKLIIIIPIFFILVTIFSALYLSLTLLNNHFKYDIKVAEQQELQLQKQYTKSQIDSIYNYIEHKKLESPIRLKSRLKNRVYTAYELAKNIYKDNKNKLNDEELQKLILETLRKVRFGKDGYFFIAHIKSDKEIISKMLPATPNAENVNAFNLKDENNNYYVQAFARTVKENKNNEGYVNYKWYKLSKKVQFDKISFVKLFEPYNWFIGYGEYYDDFEKNIKIEAKKRLDLFNYGENGYIYTVDTNYTLVQHPYRKDLIDKNLQKFKDKKGKEFIQEIVDNAMKYKDGTFVEYYWTKPNRKEIIKKIAFVKLVPKWNWIVITGIYTEDIKFSIENIKKKKEKNVNVVISNSIVFSIAILILVSLIAFIISKKINRVFLQYKEKLDEHQNELKKINLTLEDKVEEKTTELKNLNNQLEEKISKRVEELKQKDITLAQQSKMVALGEMIGNIAHQWRQPLSTISTAASGLKLKKEMDILTDEEIIKFSDGIVDNAKYLSQVIEDFKNYVKDEKLKTRFDLRESILNSLSIFDSTIHNHNLKIVEDFKQEVIIDNYKNELVQALVNILNNAKDALSEYHDDEKDRLILISTDIIENKATIIIKDSAGGISDDIIGKIFEPYFTTKDKKQGTGLGLYMTYQIIVESMNGELKVENSVFNYKNKSYKGAKFIISFDL